MKLASLAFSDSVGVWCGVVKCDIQYANPGIAFGLSWVK